MKNPYSLFAVSALALIPLLAHAQQDAGFSVKGFGTLGLVHNSSDEADFVANDTFQPNGAGRTRNTAFGVDSKLGVQADWKMSPEFSATAQLLSKQSVDNNYTPQLEWAFLKYAATPNLDIRVGRIRPAIYMLSDFLDVNYANPWVRPPMEFYDSAPVNRIDGADMLWRTAVGGVSLLVQPYIGRSDLDLPNDAEMKVRQVKGINITASSGDFTYRFGHIATKVTVEHTDLAAAIGGLQMICGMGDPVACAKATELSPIDKSASFTSLGIGYDDGDYFASAEFGKRVTKTFFNDAKTWYVSAGKHIEQWSPYVTYSSYRADSPDSFAGSTQPMVNGIVTALLQFNPLDQNTLSLGTRYELMQNVALKAQIDHVATHKATAGGSGKGMTQNATPAFAARENSLNVISLSVDFVF